MDTGGCWSGATSGHVGALAHHPCGGGGGGFWWAAGLTWEEFPVLYLHFVFCLPGPLALSCSLGISSSGCNTREKATSTYPSLRLGQRVSHHHF